MRRKCAFFIFFILPLLPFNAAAFEYRQINKEEIKIMLLSKEGITEGHEFNVEDLIEAVKQIKRETGSDIDIKINGCMINGDFEFKRLAFSEKSIYYYIKNKISIVHSTFHNDVATSYPYYGGRFQHCEFRKEVGFYRCQFLGKVDFSYSRFLENVIFTQVEFSKEADFSNSFFSMATDFSHSVFSGNSYFSKVIFEEKVSFFEVEFSKEVDFSGAGFEKEADFQRCRLKETAFFLDYVSHFPRVESKYIYFADKVDFKGATSRMLIIKWDAIKGGKLVYSPIVYSAIIKSYNELGQYDEADEATFEFRYRRRIENLHLKDGKKKTEWRWNRYMWEYVFEKICGHGVKPFLLLQWWFKMAVLFSFFFSPKGALQKGVQENHSLKSYIYPCINKATFLKRLRDAAYFSVSTFTKISLSNFVPTDNKLIHFSVKIPLYSFKDKKWKTKMSAINLFSFRLLALIEGILGWMLMALFLVCLGKVYIR